MTIKSTREIELMKVAGRVTAEAIARVIEGVRPGITTDQLDKIAENYIRGQGLEPAFIGQYGFPKTICVALNDQIVHGIPGSRVLHEGDIFTVDCGAIYKGYRGDAAATVPVGNTPTPLVNRLLRVTKASLYAGISQAVAGNYLYDIGKAVQNVIQADGFGVIRDYGGHGIGRQLHEDPHVPNYLPEDGKKGRGVRLVPGLCLAIEPMATEGSYLTKTLSDNWTVVTKDGKLSAHFEHTVVITPSGPPEILTLLPGNEWLTDAIPAAVDMLHPAGRPQ